MNTKICDTCKKELDINSFSKNPSKKDGLNRRCRECQKKYFKKYYEKNKNKYKNHRKGRHKRSREWFVEYKKTLSCKNCGINEWYVLVFHHKNGEEKDFTIANMISQGYGKDRILQEISKCDVLCANCHRRLHYLESLDLSSSS